jgi:hypothetical protein
MQEETSEGLGGSTHFIFEHKVFGVEGCYFSLMPLGDEMAAVAMESLRQEFGIADDSGDGQLLDIVAKSLKYVREIRPNDSVPQRSSSRPW